MTRDSHYLEKMSREESDAKKPESAGLGFGIMANVKWFLSEQQKVILFNENTEIRTDKITWPSEHNKVESVLLACIEKLRQAIRKFITSCFIDI